MVSLRFAARAICERPLSRSPSLHHLVHVLECLYTLCNVSRYRPPIQPGSKYITPEGAKRLRDELHQLWHEERPRVTAAVAEAAAQGDRSENAEYTYGKKRLHESDRTLRWYRIVGPDEFDMAEDYISMDSPLGRSLLGKRLDDEVSVALPGGTTLLTVVAISYGPPAS